MAMEIKLPGAMALQPPPSVTPSRAVPLEGVSARGVNSDAPDRGEATQGRTESPPSSEALSSAVKELNDYVQNIQRNLQFSMDEASGRTIITVTDALTDETIRQIPSEEVIQLARHLKGLEEQQGILLQIKA